MGELIIREQITFLYCADLQETATFYEELLGLPLVLDQGGCRIVQVAEGGGGYLGYCQRMVESKEKPGVIFTLVVEGREEVDSWYGKLKEGEVEIPEAPRLNPDYGIYHFFFQDPNGYTLEVQSFLDPGWKTLK